MRNQQCVTAAARKGVKHAYNQFIFVDEHCVGLLYGTAVFVTD